MEDAREQRVGSGRHDVGPARSQGLVDVLDRILDKGLVVAGDIRIRLADVELLTIQIRLLVCSVDKAEQIGLDWWKDHSFLADSKRSGRGIEGDRLEDLGKQLEGLTQRIQAIEGAKPKKRGGGDG